MKCWLAVLGFFIACTALTGIAQISNNNSILYKGKVGVIPLVGTHNLSGKYAPLLVDANGLLQVIGVDSASYIPAATTNVVNSLSKVFITAGDGKPVVAAPIVGVYNGTYVPIATDGLGRLIITAPTGTGIDSLNNLADASQLFATGTTGTDFAIVSAAGTHTFNIPSASATARGLITTGVQTIAGAKTFSTTPVLNALGLGLVHSSAAGVLTSSTLINTDISASAAIDFSKLATLPAANILLGNGSNVAVATAVTGDISITSGGVTTLAASIGGAKTFTGSVTVTGTTTLNGLLISNAAQNIKTTLVNTTPITLDSTYNMIFANSTGQIVLNLPSCTLNEGRTYIIKQINTGNVLINPVGTEKIDGVASKNISVQYNSLNLICAQTNWYIY